MDPDCVTGPLGPLDALLLRERDGASQLLLFEPGLNVLEVATQEESSELLGAVGLLSAAAGLAARPEMRDSRIGGVSALFPESGWHLDLDPLAPMGEPAHESIEIFGSRPGAPPALWLECRSSEVSLARDGHAIGPQCRLEAGQRLSAFAHTLENVDRRLLPAERIATWTVIAPKRVHEEPDGRTLMTLLNLGPPQLIAELRHAIGTDWPSTPEAPLKLGETAVRDGLPAALTLLARLLSQEDASLSLLASPESLFAPWLLDLVIEALCLPGWSGQCWVISADEYCVARLSEKGNVLLPEGAPA